MTTVQIYIYAKDSFLKWKSHEAFANNAIVSWLSLSLTSRKTSGAVLEDVKIHRTAKRQEETDTKEERWIGKRSALLHDDVTSVFLLNQTGRLIFRFG